jgi:hypothetical protein
MRSSQNKKTGRLALPQYGTVKPQVTLTNSKPSLKIDNIFSTTKLVPTSNDVVIKEQESSSKFECCPVCTENIEMLDVQARILHVNTCLDQSEMNTNDDVTLLTAINNSEYSSETIYNEVSIAPPVKTTTNMSVTNVIDEDLFVPPVQKFSIFAPQKKTNKKVTISSTDNKNLIRPKKSHQDVDTSSSLITDDGACVDMSGANYEGMILKKRLELGEIYAKIAALESKKISYIKELKKMTRAKPGRVTDIASSESIGHVEPMSEGDAIRIAFEGRDIRANSNSHNNHNIQDTQLVPGSRKRGRSYQSCPLWSMSHLDGSFDAMASTFSITDHHIDDTGECVDGTSDSLKVYRFVHVSSDGNGSLDGAVKEEETPCEQSNAFSTTVNVSDGDNTFSPMRFLSQYMKDNVRDVTAASLSQGEITKNDIAAISNTGTGYSNNSSSNSGSIQEAIKKISHTKTLMGSILMSLDCISKSYVTTPSSDLKCVMEMCMNATTACDDTLNLLMTNTSNTIINIATPNNIDNSTQDDTNPDVQYISAGSSSVQNFATDSFHDNEHISEEVKTAGIADIASVSTPGNRLMEDFEDDWETQTGVLHYIPDLSSRAASPLQSADTASTTTQADNLNAVIGDLNNSNNTDHEKKSVTLHSRCISLIEEPTVNMIEGNVCSEDIVTDINLNGDISDIISAYIKNDKLLYEDILQFKPVDVDNIRLQMKNSGIKIRKDALMQFLDSQYIFASCFKRKGKCNPE